MSDPRDVEIIDQKSVRLGGFTLTTTFGRIKSRTAREATGFVRGGMLFLEPPHRWRVWDRRIFADCECGAQK